MDKNLKKAFWTLFLCFCAFITMSIFPIGAFNGMSYGGATILALFYILVGVCIYRFLKANPKFYEGWFSE